MESKTKSEGGDVWDLGCLSFEEEFFMHYYEGPDVMSRDPVKLVPSDLRRT